jgi:hypothetical protein
VNKGPLHILHSCRRDRQALFITKQCVHMLHISHSCRRDRQALFITKQCVHMWVNVKTVQ